MDHPPQALSADSEGARGLHTIGILDLLQQDPRPTFVLDGRKPVNSRNASISPAYWNPALAGIDDGGLLTSIKADNVTIITGEQRPLRSEFNAWIVTREFTESCTFRGYRWTKFVLTSQWIVVSGSVLESPACWRKTQSKEVTVTRGLPRSEVAAYDWTGKSFPTRISPYVAWARSIDWSQTPMGPISHWSSQLRSVANLVMQDPQPAVIFWGPDLTMIYNEAYVGFLGSLHPCIGLSAREVLASVWSEYFEPTIVRNLNGETVEQEDLAIYINRKGFLEESYFSIKFIPILDSDGATVGHYVPLVETVSRETATLTGWSDI